MPTCLDSMALPLHISFDFSFRASLLMHESYMFVFGGFPYTARELTEWLFITNTGRRLKTCLPEDM